MSKPVWEMVDEQNKLLKEIATYLTRQFVWHDTEVIPKDECMSEAKEVITKVKQHYKQENLLIVKGTEHTEEFNHRLDRPELREKIWNIIDDAREIVPDSPSSTIWTTNKDKATCQILALFDTEQKKPVRLGLRKELIDWITAYKDVAERNALAEDPDESTDYLIKALIEPLIEEAKKQGEKKALRRILRESRYLAPYELIDSIKQALKEEK